MDMCLSLIMERIAAGVNNLKQYRVTRVSITVKMQQHRMAKAVPCWYPG